MLFTICGKTLATVTVFHLFNERFGMLTSRYFFYASTWVDSVGLIGRH